MRTTLVAARAAVLVGALAAAGCSSSGSQQQGGTASPGATPPPTAPPLPFHYQAKGESSSPTFAVARAGAYKVSYVLQGSTDQPGCVVGIVLVADDGSSVPVVSDVKLQPSDTRQDQVSETLAAGRWRFQEAGGCAWTVTVDAS